ncbi:hypothetical protein A3770_08p53170 [Chloropicon primus]|uniref:BHLH domain-containing protein n=2 Tax=Chloropicon primus TaxID=1764295 RepID=A0A5B8MQJ4_9CHLO|nr:hypothetical protein A3770_08p53170 [Chloropicon primus]|eukprot:QDZ22799.1 hypothetical protein A3770_08p53170 [Chloropicon primus]
MCSLKNELSESTAGTVGTNAKATTTTTELSSPKPKDTAAKGTTTAETNASSPPGSSSRETEDARVEVPTSPTGSVPMVLDSSRNDAVNVKAVLHPTGAKKEQQGNGPGPSERKPGRCVAGKRVLGVTKGGTSTAAQSEKKRRNEIRRRIETLREMLPDSVRNKNVTEVLDDTILLINSLKAMLENAQRQTSFQLAAAPGSFQLMGAPTHHVVPGGQQGDYRLAGEITSMMQQNRLQQAGIPGVSVGVGVSGMSLEQQQQAQALSQYLQQQQQQAWPQAQAGLRFAANQQAVQDDTSLYLAKEPLTGDPPSKADS